MRNPFASPTSASVGLLIVRVPMGLYFVMAGWAKIFSLGVTNFVSKASGNLPPFLPDYLGKSYLYLLPFFELSMGALLIMGLWTRLAGLITSLILISIIWAVTGISDPNLPFHQNVIFLSVTLLLLFAGGGSFTVDRMIRSGMSGPKSSSR
ncbi:MAG TPA: DoxX family protein [Tepidisphaeraceae bacterium]|nr:DoxX family protein [Tepidisphaeraceae bacterium]